MKKAIAVVAVVCVMFAAGSDLAQTKERKNQQQNVQQQMKRPQKNAQNFQERGPRFQNASDDFRGPRGDFRPGFDGRGRKGPMFTPDMPKEIREKATELAKLRVDLKEAMTSSPLNKEKALEIHAKMQKLEQEVETWKFTQRLERIEEMQRQHELNKNVPPATIETAPEKPSETPEAEPAK